MQFGFDSMDLSVQLGHALTQLRQRDQSFLISADYPFHVLVQPCLFAP
jgi:hypothetical protein